MQFTFVETEVFTRRISRFRLEEELRVLQVDLLQDPQAGALDPGTGGLRKVRMGASVRGKGKRSGARVHYLFLPKLSRIYLIFVYGKDEQDTLTPSQKTQLRAVVEDIKRKAR
jgi:hypothetical protein